MSWKKLEKDYVKHGTVLCLGAGVSLGCHLPTWKDLLGRLAETTDSLSVGDIESAGLGMPAAAAVIEKQIGSREDFVEAVRAALYRDFPYYPRGYPKSQVSDFVRYVQESNPTLRAVASFCTVKTSSRTYAANPRVAGVISFNLDALVQAYSKARFRTRILRTVERPSASPTPGKINVYHVHGFLRYDGKAGEPAKEAPDAVVLTEHDYFDTFNDPTGLFTYTFLYLLRECRFLFIGLSMLDDNLRRLLHYSLRERRTGYEAEGRRLSTSKAVRHYAVLQKPDGRAARRILQESLLGLGVAPLWVNSFDELPAKMSRLYEAGGGDWSDVW